MAVVTSAHGLADELAAFTTDTVERLVTTHFPEWRVPGAFAGHRVGPDVRADLAFTIGHLRRCGVKDVAGTPVDDAIRLVLAPIDGPRTDTFFSYRVAETLALLGPFDAADGNLAAACDSTAALPALRDGRLPRNYAAVLARCEVARAALGLIPEDDPTLLALVDETRQLLAGGVIDDSRTGIGRYDIYTPDVYLFTEPFADRLGGAWREGAATAVSLVERVAATNGAGITWGRSSGALAVCLTVELAGLVNERGLGADARRWVALGSVAAREVRRWFGGDGVISAHQRRSTYDYRGPFRRLQMTLDCLGKLAAAAVALRAGPDTASSSAFASRDELVVLDAATNASVWTYRSATSAFVLPFVGATVSDYLPALRNPGLFEVPVDADLPTGVPFVFRGGRRFVAAGLPSEVQHLGDGHLVVHHDGWVASNLLEAAADERDRPVPGTRTATYRVDGRTVHVDEHLTFLDPDRRPQVLALQVAETTDRPLLVRFELSGGTTGAVTTVDTSGVKEWRSFWAELPRVHQVDVDVAPDVRFTWSVTPKLRVLTTSHEHHYHRSLYDPLVRDGLVVDSRLAMGRVGDRRYLDELFARHDQFHLHWPEWFLGHDLERNRRFVDALVDGGVRVVWTQHNLVPHDRDERLDAVYRLWASVADAVLHHSDVGRRRVTERYEFAPGAVHAVVPHPHFGHFARPARARHDGVLRLGIVGAPRPEKDVQLVMDAVSRCARQDVRLDVYSLGPPDRVPDDPRITAVGYEMVDRDTYEARLATLDALVLPFGDGGDLLTTGTVGDAVAHGLPVLTSSWPYLAEALGDAAIPFGPSADDLARLIDHDLTADRLSAAAAASRALQPRLAADTVARDLYAVLDALGTARL